ncbi:MAG: FAD-dependent monooxygenase, partial [Gammaproteobacteria bacterium]|nr:FAD-dependent monooxygenase [Gammaproteobacteria bacterium]
GQTVATVTVNLSGAEQRLHARLVVVADGGRSKVREMAGINAEIRDYRQTAILSTVTPELPHRNTAYERFTATGPLAFLPTRENRFALVWTAWSSEVDALMSLPDQAFLDRLQQRFGYRVGILSRLGKRNAYPLQLVKINDPICPRVVMIGNAAHAIHPIAGQGFNLGLRDVATLAEVVHDAQRSGQDIGEYALLAEYARWRKRDTRATTAFTDGLVRVFSNEFPPTVALRSLGLLAVDNLPFVKRVLMQRTMGLTGKTPRLSRGLELT